MIACGSGEATVQVAGEKECGTARLQTCRDEDPDRPGGLDTQFDYLRTLYVRNILNWKVN